MGHNKAPDVSITAARVLALPAAYQADSIERLAEKIDIEALRSQSRAVKTQICEQLLELEKELRNIILLSAAEEPDRAVSLAKVLQFVQDTKAVVDQLAPSQPPGTSLT